MSKEALLRLPYIGLPLHQALLISALSTSAVEGGEVEVTVEARLRVENGDGEALARETASDSATVSVEAGSVDPDEYGSVGGSGELRIEKA